MFFVALASPHYAVWLQKGSKNHCPASCMGAGSASARSPRPEGAVTVMPLRDRALWRKARASNSREQENQEQPPMH